MDYFLIFANVVISTKNAIITKNQINFNKFVVSLKTNKNETLVYHFNYDARDIDGKRPVS